MAWRAIESALPKAAIISSDIGNNCAIGNAYPSFEEGRKYLAPGLFGPCGYGLPSIVGAKIGCPDTPVVGFAGDGAFGIAVTELTAIGRDEWPAITMDARGEVLVPLDERAIRERLKVLLESGIEALTIALFNSYANDAHERRIAEIARSIRPDIPVSTSAAIMPERLGLPPASSRTCRACRCRRCRVATRRRR